MHKISKEMWTKAGMIAFAAVFMIALSYCIIWYFNVKSIDKLMSEEVEGIQNVPFELVKADSGIKSGQVDFMSVDFADLKKRNEDIVAWLSVSNVNINMPITQTTDNEYYLDHDVDKNPNRLGWVFADARSDLDNPGLNTVLYGHNAMSRQMFGSLKSLLNLNDASNPLDKRIYLTTPDYERVYDIVSIYVTEFDDWDYVHQHYSSEEDKESFLSKVRSSNQVPYVSDTTLTNMDEYLTFSTCYGPVGSSKRLVVHAKLIGERSVN